MKKDKLTNIFFFGVAIFLLFITVYYGRISGEAVKDVKCEFVWPQKVIIDGISYSCSYDRPWCNNDHAQSKMAECCKDHSPYRDCISVGTTQTSCIDSDGGKDTSKRGDIKIDNIWKDADYCYEGSEGNVVAETSVGSGYLKEFYCDSQTYFWDKIQIKSGEKCKGGVIVNVEVSQASQSACTDSDNGKDTSKKGDIRINGVWKDADYCYEGSTGNVIAETATGHLKEFYCKDNTYTWDTIKVKSDEKCVSGAIEKSQQAAQAVCTETDNGRDPYVRGTIIYNGDAIGTDFCADNGGNGVDEALSGEGFLVEHVCEGNDPKSYGIYISYNEECKDGTMIACNGPCTKSTPVTQTPCFDTDNGNDINVKGTLSYNGEVLGTDYCSTNNWAKVDEVLSGEGFLVEHVCEGNDPKNYKFFMNSGQKCKDGTFVSCNGPCASEKGCVDSDVDASYQDGKNYAVKGIIKIDGNEVAHDHCSDNGVEVYETGYGGWLFEYYCEGGKEKYIVVRNPSKKCVDGKIA